MTATIAEVRAGLAARGATISGLKTSPYMQPRPTPPMLCVLPVIPDTPRTFSGGEDMEFDLWVYVQSVDLPRAQEEIDLYMSPTGAKSIKAAIDGDPSLGGLSGVHASFVGWQQYGALVDIYGTQAFGAPCRVRVSV